MSGGVVLPPGGPAAIRLDAAAPRPQGQPAIRAHGGRRHAILGRQPHHTVGHHPVVAVNRLEAAVPGGQQLAPRLDVRRDHPGAPPIRRHIAHRLLGADDDVQPAAAQIHRHQRDPGEGPGRVRPEDGLPQDRRLIGRLAQGRQRLPDPLAGHHRSRDGRGERRRRLKRGGWHGRRLGCRGARADLAARCTGGGSGLRRNSLRGRGRRPESVRCGRSLRAANGCRRRQGQGRCDRVSVGLRGSRRV